MLLAIYKAALAMSMTPVRVGALTDISLLSNVELLAYPNEPLEPSENALARRDRENAHAPFVGADASLVLISCSIAVPHSGQVPETLPVRL